MVHHHTLHVLAHNQAGTLPRILLAFARRRLCVQALHFYDLDPARPAELQIDLDCPTEVAQALTRELRSLENVCQVHVENLQETTPGPLATQVDAA
ncbi:MAG: hypothetical protein KDK91_12110 [Gammaproteobacteria bacterium]|nr:hypothetical protein [Gammaproteobacteria bacterium]